MVQGPCAHLGLHDYFDSYISGELKSDDFWVWQLWTKYNSDYSIQIIRYFSWTFWNKNAVNTYWFSLSKCLTFFCSSWFCWVQHLTLPSRPPMYTIFRLRLSLAEICKIIYDYQHKWIHKFSCNSVFENLLKKIGIIKNNEYRRSPKVWMNVIKHCV
jgi:hypothetical protein